MKILLYLLGVAILLAVFIMIMFLYIFPPYI